MKSFVSLALLALLLGLCPAFAQDGLQSFPAPPEVRRIGELQAEQIGRELRSATVRARENVVIVEFAYDRDLEIALIQTTPEILQVAIGMITPDAGTLAVTLFSETSAEQVIGVSFTQPAADGDPLAGLPAREVRRMLDAFQAATGSQPGSGDEGQLVAASVDWRASDAPDGAGATLLRSTPATAGTFGVYAQLFRTGFSFAQGYDVRTKPNGDMQARRPDGPRSAANFVELRHDGAGGGVVLMGYDPQTARGLERYLAEVLRAVDEPEAADVVRPATPQGSGDGQAPDPQTLTGALQSAGK
ncbi:MAG: hypothetical protein R3F62_24195 [Planctomycetota bacterium]